MRFLTKDVEKRMRTLEKQHQALAAEMASVDPSDHHGLADIGGRLAVVDGELAAAEDEWLALAEEAEA